MAFVAFNSFQRVTGRVSTKTATANSVNISNYNFALPSQPANSISTSKLTIPGWTTGGSCLNYYVANGNGAPYGFVTCPFPQFFLCQMPSNSFSITQTITLSSVKTYTLSFYSATRGSYWTINNQITATLNNISVSTSTLFTVSQTGYAWTQFSASVPVTTSGTYALVFTFTTVNGDQGEQSIGLTQIKVTYVWQTPKAVFFVTFHWNIYDNYPTTTAQPAIHYKLFQFVAPDPKDQGEVVNWFS